MNNINNMMTTAGYRGDYNYYSAIRNMHQVGGQVDQLGGNKVVAKFYEKDEMEFNESEFAGLRYAISKMGERGLFVGISMDLKQMWSSILNSIQSTTFRTRKRNEFEESPFYKILRFAKSVA